MIERLFDYRNTRTFEDLTEEYYTSDSIYQFLIVSDLKGYTRIPFLNEFRWHMFLLRHKIDILKFMMVSSIVSITVISAIFTTIMMLLIESIGFFSILTTPLLMFIDIFIGYRTITFIDRITEVDVMSHRYNNGKQNDWHFQKKTK